MNKFKRDALAVLVLAALGVVTYQLLLDDEAHTSVKNMVSGVTNSLKKVRETMEAQKGVTMDDAEAAARAQQQEIRRQWERLGY